MKKAIEYFFLLALLPFGSCKHGLGAKAYVEYVQNKKNGLKKIIQTSGWEYTMLYKPYDYIIFLEGKGRMQQSEAAQRKAVLEGTAWFTISIKRADGAASPLRYGISSLDGYDRRLDYFLNETKKDIRLIYGRDTLKPLSYLFENNYNLTPQETIDVGFALPPGESRPGKEMQLSYDDQVFKNGILKAIYKSEDLKSIPDLDN